MLAVTTRRRVDVDAGRDRADREQRGQQAAGDLLVEAGQPAPRHRRAGCRSTPTAATNAPRAPPPVAAEHEADAGAHHAEARGHRPARAAVPGRDDAGEPAAGLVAVDRAR